MSFFQGRDGTVYGVDGMGRGVRVGCGSTQASPLGLAPPSVGPAITASSLLTGKYVSAIYLTKQGAGYTETPSVIVTGGTPSTGASARAEMRDGSVRDVVVTVAGRGYVTPPAVQFSGGFPSSGTFGATVSGGVASVSILSGGTGYSVAPGNPPQVVFSTAQGLTNASAVPSVDSLGRIAGIQVLAAGTGATTTGVTASITGGGGAGAQLAVQMQYRLAGVTVISGGTGHLVPPVFSVEPAAADTQGAGAAVKGIVSAGGVTSATVVAGGAYSLPPTVFIADTQAEAVAVLAPPLKGKYLCGYRFLDADGVPSSISHLTPVDVPSGSDSLLWTLSHATSDARAAKIELWRTTAGQQVVLYRVAAIAIGTSTYTDSFSDPELLDPERAGFGFMPITLPSGQLNARRFAVPPGSYSVAVTFQDRAWFAGDTTGKRPNSLLFSEVDEPESVPVENEIVLQENVGEHDTIVGLVPFGSELLIVQTGHMYSLRYVAQPVIDASFALVAYRGALHSACATVMGGVVFLADSYGIYAYDGTGEKALSAAVDNFWRDGLIDFAQAAKFHLSADYGDKVIRFHYCAPGDTEPVRALCFCVATEAWWSEEYPVPVTASAPLVVGGKRTVAYGSQGGFRRFAAGADPEGAIGWKYRSGNLILTDSPSRSVGVVYTPTASTSPLALSLHYNGSSAARTMPVTADRGTGWASAGTQAILDMSASRSPLGTASGYAQAMFAGRLDPRSGGADRHVAVAFAGTRSADPVVLHGVTIEGVT
jgi:hypothetical protein